MPMPIQIDFFCAIGMSRGSYSLLSICAPYCAQSAGSFCITGMAAWVIVDGHSTPASTSPCR